MAKYLGKLDPLLVPALVKKELKLGSYLAVVTSDHVVEFSQRMAAIDDCAVRTYAFLLETTAFRALAILVPQAIALQVMALPGVVAHAKMRLLMWEDDRWPEWFSQWAIDSFQLSLADQTEAQLFTPNATPVENN